MKENEIRIIDSYLQHKLTMQLGLSTYSFPWAFGVAGYPAPRITAQDLIRFAASQRIFRVQLGDNFPLHLLSKEKRQGIKEEADFLAVQLEVGTRRLTVENITQYISITQELGAPFLRVVIDDADFHPSEEEVVHTIHSLLPLLREKNMILAIENHDRFSAAALVRIIKATDIHFVGICLDTANSIGAGEGINEILPLLAPYTVNLHIKDFTIQRVAHKMGFCVAGCTAGDGMLNIPSLITELKKFDRCGTVTLELWSDPKETPERTVQQEAEWVEKSLRYLKTIVT